MNQVSAQKQRLCILCNEDPKDFNSGNSVGKDVEDILLGMMQFWDIEELTLKEISFVTDFLFRNKNLNLCSSCTERILNYDLLLRQVKALVATFGKQLKNVVKNYEQNVTRQADTESQENAPRKSHRKRRKRKELVESESDEEEKEKDFEKFIEKEKCLIYVNKETYDRLTHGDLAEVDQVQILTSILRDIFPKCSLTFYKLDSYCQSKSCGLKIRITFNNDVQSETHLMVLSLNGDPKHGENEDPKRIFFEMSKIEFTNANVCEFCCKKLDDKQEISKHAEKETEYTCPECQLIFKNFQIRNSHFLNQHTTDAPYNCEKCLKSFKTTQKCSDHQKKCLDERRFSCKACHKTFTSTRNLECHVQVVHLKTDSKWSHQCPHCSKKFYKSHNLKSHLLTHEKEKKLVCPIEGCTTKFKRRKALDVHLAKVHGGNRESHLCSFCGKNFASQSGIKLHMAKHTGKEYIKKRHVCSICEKAFRCKVDLETHSLVHSKEKPHSCNICNTSFTQKSSLKDHLNVHWNTFQCQKCSKSFGRQRYLDQHYKTCGINDLTADENDESSTLIMSTREAQSVITTQEVECVIINDADVNIEPQKLHLIPSGDGTYVVRSMQQGEEVVTGTNVLAHFNESGNIAMLEYTDPPQQ